MPLVVFGQDAQQPSSCVVTSDNIAKTKGSPVIPFTPEIDIPGLFTGSTSITGLTIAEYIRAVYIFFVWIVGLLAVVMIIYGGIRWVAAAGNPGQITAARETVINAISGVALALLSVVILNTINPNLTKFTSLSLQSVSACDINYISNAVKGAGELITQCSAQVAAGEPVTYCTRFGCVAKLNDQINLAGQKYGVDPILIKALIEVESPKKILDGTKQRVPMSGPTTGRESATSSRRGSAYGFGQIVAKSLAGYAKVAEVKLPAACDKDVAQLRKPTGELIDECASALDADPQLQFNIIAGGLKDAIRSNQLSNEPAVLAMAWHLGQQGAINFFDGNGPIPESQQAAETYVKIFNASYSRTCVAAKQLLNQNDIPGKI